MKVVFHPIAPIAFVAVASIALVSFLIFREWVSNHKYRISRILASVIAVSSLTALALRPSVVSVRSAAGAILLTDDYDSKTADSLVKVNKGLTILLAPEAKGYGLGQRLSNWDELRLWESSLKFVVGTGIPTARLTEISHHGFTFIPTKNLIGLTELSSGPFFTNRINTISGFFRPTSASALLVLIGPGGREDSVIIEKPTKFQLSINPKQAGHLNYQLSVRDKETTVETLPVNILPSEKLSVMMLLDAPSSESRYLKNFLADMGHRVIVRYRTSLSTHRYEYLNTSELITDPFSTTVFGKLDVVVAESAALNQLSTRQKSFFQSQISHGVGLIEVVSDPSSISTFNRGLNVVSLPEGKDTLRIKLAGSKELQSVTAVAVGKSVDNDTHILQRASGNRWTTAWRSVGAGKIGVQLLHDTWCMAMSENQALYSQLWTSVIENVAKVKRNKFNISLNPSFPVVENDPIGIDILSTGTLPTLSMDAELVPLRENASWDDVWHSTIWTSAGWHRLSVTEDSTSLDFYTFPGTAWKSIRRSQQITKNEISAAPSSSKTSSYVFDDPISPVWFVLAFLATAGFLWLVPKL